MAETKEVIILDFQVDGKDAIVSIENLTKANKALREERKSLDAQTETGKARIAAINAELDRNTTVIKNNSSAIEKQRLNVGNYKDSLDKLVPGLGATISGFQGMAKSALAFIATPIGAVIGVLGLAIGALMKYFQGSEEGQDRWNKIVAVGSTIIERFTDIIEDLGKWLFETGGKAGWLGGVIKTLLIEPIEIVSNKIGEFIGWVISGIEKIPMLSGVIYAIVGPFKLLGDLIGVAKDATVEFFETAIKDGVALADMENKAEEDNRRITVDRAKRDLEVSTLRRKADEAEGQQKLFYLNQALALEAESIKEEVAAAQIRFNIAKEKARINGDDKDALADIAKAEADLFSAQRGAFDETRKINKERIALEQSLRDEKEKSLLKEIEINEAVKKMYQDRADKAAITEQALLDGTIARLDAQQQVESDNFALMEEAAKADADTEIAESNRAYDWYVDIQKKKLAAFIKTSNDIINYTKSTANSIFGIEKGEYDLKENALNVSLANQKTALNTQYAGELASLKDKFDKGLISEEDYKKEVLLVNQKQQADIKDAEIKQAKAINDIKQKSFEVEKKNNIANAFINVAQAVLKTLADLPFPFSLIPAAAAAIFGGIQIDQISRQQFVPATFGAGGPINGPSHSSGGVDINAEGGEFMMRKSAVDKYGMAFMSQLNDGAMIANASTSGMSGGSQPPIKVDLVLKELREFQNRVELKEAIVTA